MKARTTAGFGCALMACLLAACVQEAAMEDPPLEPATDLSWRLDEAIESLVHLSWQQSGAATGKVEYSFDEGEWLLSPVEFRDAGAHDDLLLGIPFDTEVRARVVLERDGAELTSAEVTAITGVIPDELPLPEVLVSQPDQWEPGMDYMLGSINPSPGAGDHPRRYRGLGHRLGWVQVDRAHGSAG